MSDEKKSLSEERVKEAMEEMETRLEDEKNRSEERDALAKVAEMDALAKAIGGRSGRKISKFMDRVGGLEGELQIMTGAKDSLEIECREQKGKLAEAREERDTEAGFRTASDRKYDDLREKVRSYLEFMGTDTEGGEYARDHFAGFDYGYCEKCWHHQHKVKCPTGCSCNIPYHRRSGWKPKDTEPASKPEPSRKDYPLNDWCKGVEVEPGVFSGCACDCPRCEENSTDHSIDEDDGFECSWCEDTGNMVVGHVTPCAYCKRTPDGDAEPEDAI